MIADSILQTIGNTPHVRVARLFPDAAVWIKSERSNPGGSIKDRIALAMIEAAEADGRLQPGGTIVEPTSGNTGIGLAMVAAVKGYRIVLVMPESMSIERRRLMLAYGATFDLTPKEKGMKGAIERAIEIVAETPGSWMPQQFDNPANIAVHVRTTAREILADFADEPLDALVTGVGTGGHITGVAQVLRRQWPALRVYAVEPTLSPVISGGQPGPHAIQGIGAGFIPANLHTDLLTGVVQVDPAAAKAMALRSAREEGMLVGISSGATLQAIAQTLPDLGADARVLGFNYDTGERYLSVPDFLPNADGVPPRFTRFAAFDWSGRAVARPPGIALATCDAGDAPPVLVSPAPHWSRGDALAWLLDQAASGTDLLVGIDFSPALPFADRDAYFPDWPDGPGDARGLWTLVDALCAAEPHLSASTFVAHPGIGRHYRHAAGGAVHRGDRFEGSLGRLRVVERRCRALRLGNAVSCFNLIGASQVGKSSLTGMRLLHALDGRVPVWPFDPLPARGPVLVEIYTAVAARAAGLAGSRTKLRDGPALDAALARLGTRPHAPLARYDDHATDALLAAAWLRAVAADTALWHPPALTPALAATEGWTFGIP